MNTIGAASLNFGSAQGTAQKALKKRNFIKIGGVHYLSPFANTKNATVSGDLMKQLAGKKTIVVFNVGKKSKLSIIDKLSEISCGLKGKGTVDVKELGGKATLNADGDSLALNVGEMSGGYFNVYGGLSPVIKKMTGGYLDCYEKTNPKIEFTTDKRSEINNFGTGVVTIDKKTKSVFPLRNHLRNANGDIKVNEYVD